MTGEPNQQQSVHPSVFSFEPYPPTQPIVWNQANPFANPPFIQNPSNEAFRHLNVFETPSNLPPFPSNALPPQAHSSPNVIQSTSSDNFMQGFSFGRPQQNEGVVQFPFHISQVYNEFENKGIRCKRKTDSPP